MRVDFTDICVTHRNPSTPYTVVLRSMHKVKTITVFPSSSCTQHPLFLDQGTVIKKDQASVA